MSKAKYTVTTLERFDIRRIQQARSVLGVASAQPVYVESWESLLRLPGQRARRIRVLASHLEDRALHIPQLDTYAASLRPSPHRARRQSEPRELRVPTRFIAGRL